MLLIGLVFNTKWFFISIFLIFFPFFCFEICLFDFLKAKIKNYLSLHVCFHGIFIIQSTYTLLGSNCMPLKSMPRPVQLDWPYSCGVIAISLRHHLFFLLNFWIPIFLHFFFVWDFVPKEKLLNPFCFIFYCSL